MEGGFVAWDWVVFIASLVISGAIGIFFAIRGRKNETSGELLMGGRDIGLLPIALSILVSFQSAVLILGVPAEMYTQGIMYFLYGFGFFLGGALAAIVFVPLFYPLQLTSMYEYLELRFNSKSVKLTASLISITSMLFSGGIISFAPSTALESVSGFPEWASFLLMGGVCTFYTFMGGLKAVVWVDTFQAFIMLAGLLAIIIKGIVAVGSFSETWHLNEVWGRTYLWNFDPDPTVRHTFWSLTVASIITSAGAHGCSQASIQRFCAVKTLKKAKLAVVVNICGNLIMTTLACLAGVAIFAYFANEGCDPISNKDVGNPNQLVPYFVMQQLAYPGVPGLFIACLYSGALSSLSTNLSSLCALTWEDILKQFFKSKDEKFKSNAIRILTLIYGALGIGMSFIMQQFSGTVLQLSVSILGATAGPLTGIIVLAAFFPCANWIGAIAGSIAAYGITLWITVAKNDLPEIMLDLDYPTATCPSSVNASIIMSTVTMTTTAAASATDIHGIQRFYMLSYLWNAGFGLLICLLLGVVLSLLTGRTKREDIDPKLLISIVDTFCCCLPEKVKQRLSGRDKYTINKQDKDDLPTDLPDIIEQTENAKNKNIEQGHTNMSYSTDL